MIKATENNRSNAVEMFPQRDHYHLGANRFRRCFLEVNGRIARRGRVVPAGRKEQATGEYPNRAW